MEPSEKNGLPVIAFASDEDFATWLEVHHADTPGLWLRMYKKHTGKPSVAWKGAVVVALRYGWIDSVANKLIAEGKIHPAGLAEVELY